jgi:hypothetical protein
MACCDHGYGRFSGRPRVSAPATYRPGTPRNQHPAIARWHAHLRGLATSIHETSGLKIIRSFPTRILWYPAQVPTICITSGCSNGLWANCLRTALMRSLLLLGRRCRYLAACRWTMTLLIRLYLGLHRRLHFHSRDRCAPGGAG